MMQSFGLSGSDIYSTKTWSYFSFYDGQLGFEQDKGTLAFFAVKGKVLHLLFEGKTRWVYSGKPVSIPCMPVETILFACCVEVLSDG